MTNPALLLLIAGGGYLAWANRATVLPWLKSLASKATGSATPAGNQPYLDALLSLRPFVEQRGIAVEIAAYNALSHSVIEIPTPVDPVVPAKGGGE